MPLQEQIPDSLYRTPPVHETYGDVASTSDRRRADEQSLEQIALSPGLTVLHDKLLTADEPSLAIAIRLSTVAGTKEFAHTYIAYGQTKPSEGLRPTRRVSYDGRGGYRARPGLALSLDPSTRGAVAYWPSYDWSADEGSKVVGHWEHLQRDTFTAYNHGREEVTEYDDEIVFEDRPFTVWPTGFGRFGEGAPAVINTARETRREIERSVRAVHSADARGDGIRTVRRGDVQQHTIILGKRAVRSALNTLAKQAWRDPGLPEPLADMLVAVDESLSVPA